MSISNITKYACFGDGDMYPVKDIIDNTQRYIKVEDLQQIVSEIIAFKSKIEDSYDEGYNDAINTVLVEVFNTEHK
jgi:hypothetical protein